MIHTSLSPNAEKDDVFLALKTLFQPWTWHNWSTVMAVEKRLREILQIPNVVCVDSGRTALYTILKAAGIGEGDEVIVQAYTCVAVPDPVLWVGAQPVYVDCKNDLTMDVADLQKKISPKTRAVVVQHTFGQPADMEAIMQIAHGKNILVIEDCAHALGGEYQAKVLGSIGHISFFSFGRDKSISSVFGGAIATRDQDLFEIMQRIIAGYPTPSGVWVAQQLNHPLVLAKAKALYDFFNLGKAILEFAKRLGLISKAVLPEELSGGRPAFTLHKFSPALARLALHQLDKLPRFIACRQELGRVYAKKLAGKASKEGGEGIEAPPFVPGHAYLRYTIFTKDSRALMQKAKAQNIYLGDWYTTVIAPVGVSYKNVGYEPGSCPNAERLAQISVNLPTHIGMTREKFEKIIQLFS